MSHSVLSADNTIMSQKDKILYSYRAYILVKQINPLKVNYVI
jgi:hypothetical protein